VEKFGEIPAKSLIISSRAEGKGVKLWKKCLLLWTLETTKVDLTGDGSPRLPTLESALFQHARRHQLFLDVALQGLDQEFAQVRGLGFGPRHPGETLDRGAEHL
jgi:hypothetical protein